MQTNTFTRSLALTVIVSTLTAALACRADIEGDYEYRVEGGQAAIIAYYGWQPGDLSIPSSLGGRPVSEIAAAAFAGCEGLTGITVPPSVTFIAAGAFADCPQLQRATFHNDLAQFSAVSVFGAYGGALKEVTVGGAVPEISGMAFARCTGITNVVIGAGVSRITGGAFYGCTGLSAFRASGSGGAYCITNGVICDATLSTLIQYPAGRPGGYELPSTVVAIGDHAFAGCAGLAGVTLHSGVGSIGSYAFACCANLTTAAVPASVTAIGVGAFAPYVTLSGEPVSLGEITTGQNSGEASGLLAIDVALGNLHYASVDGVLFNKARSLLIQHPGGRRGAYTVPPGTAQIGYRAFCACTSLTEVTLAGETVRVGVQAFARCSGLTSLALPAALSSLGYWAFEDCSALSNVLFRGDAPDLDTPDVLAGTPSTVYYRPGASGWGNEFCGRPTRCWDPRVQAGGSCARTEAGFAFTLVGTPLIPIRVEACADLADGEWAPLLTGALDASGALGFNDPDAASLPARFYRIAWP